MSATTQQDTSLKRKGPAQSSSSSKRQKQSDIKASRSSATSENSKGRDARPKTESNDEASVNEDIGRMDGQLLADHFARQIKRFEPDISIVELEDRRKAASNFADTSSWEGQRNLESLPAFLERFSGQSHKSLSRCAEEKGSPHTLVISASGIRAADLTRALRTFQTKEAAVAKLFAKHIKLKEAVESTKKQKMNIGVGTPQRIADLIEQGALSLDRVERIVVDASFVNQKRRGILDMPETEKPLSRLLVREEMNKRFSDSGSAAKIIVY